MILTVFLLFACASTPTEEPKKNYPAFLESRPRSILVMPPINRSMDIKAPITFLGSSTMPLAESGYYVIPVTLSDQTFKQNGVTVAEDAHAIPFNKLYEIFGADAALYITITSFGTSYHLFDSITEAAANATLIDLRNGQKLWSGKASLSEKTSNKRGGNSVNSLQELAVSILGAALESAIDQVVNTASNKAHDMGRQANYRMLSAENRDGILYGPYHPEYGTD